MLLLISSCKFGEIYFHCLLLCYKICYCVDLFPHPKLLLNSVNTPTPHPKVQFNMATLSSFASLAILSLVLVIGVIISRAEAKPRAFFVFGDSLVDNGNNNYMATTTCVDAPPYGIDYPPSHRPTGCFSNGYNIPNLIS